jgi:hypothetical protein
MPRGRRSGEVVWLRKLVNQRGECVQSGRISTLVSSQSFLPRSRKTIPEMKSGKLRPNPAKVEAETDEVLG